MEPEVVELARTAGSAVVSLMAGDAWTRTRDGLVALWHRAHPDRAEAVGAELDASRSDLIAARASGDEESEDELRAEWQGRLRRLLAADPDAVAALRQLLDEVSPTQSSTGSDVGEVRMSAKATGHGRVYQAGRDQHITEK